MSLAMQDHPLQIRLAVPQDVPVILSFIHDLAIYEKEPRLRPGHPPPISTATASAPSPVFTSLLAEWLGQPAGFALYFYNYSTWQGHHGIHLEDLYVHPEFRGKGIGKALLAKVAGVAVVEGCPRLEWNVLDWNKSAIDFYHEMGAQISTDWRIMRVTGASLCNLSERCD